jgi:hypothetical protein
LYDCHSDILGVWCGENLDFQMIRRKIKLAFAFVFVNQNDGSEC